MSCYSIYYKDGAKMMRPVPDREEYLKLRGTRSQVNLVAAVRRGEVDKKSLLLQMNYSCLPNDDGSLKGSTRMSTSVGMDIDWTPSPLPNEGEEQIAARKEEWLRMVPELVLSKKEELGLLMLERSATKGFHLVFRRRPELSQEDNLRWASDLLGVDYDKGAKDITRVFFSTSVEDLIYLSDSLFEIEEVEEVKEEVKTVNGLEVKKEVKEDDSQVNSKLLSLNSKLEYHGIPYAVIVDAWLGGEKVQPGDRHHTSLILADQLRYITDNDPALIEQILRQTPFVQEIVQERNENVKNTVESAQKFEFLKGMPKRMQDSIERTQASIQNSKLKIQNEAEGDEDADKDLECLVQGWNPPKMPKKLPRLVQLLIKPFPKEYHPMLVVTACVVLGAIASHFRTTYIDGRTIAANLYAAIIAGSGKGKSWVTMLVELMCRHTLQSWDDQEWRKVRENQEMRDRMSNAKDKPAKYHPRFRIMETMSKTSLLEVQTNLGENGMLLCNYTESDELANASKAQFSNISVLLRKAWDLDTHRQFYMSEASCNTQCRLCAAILLTGTPRSVLTRLFADTESGMMQRFLPMMLPDVKRTFRPPVFTPLSSDEETERDSLLVNLWQKDLALGNDTLTLQMPKTQKMIQQWYDELEERYNDGELTEAEADLSHRIGQFMQRAAIPFLALYEEEQKDVLELVRWLGDFAYYNICHIFASRVAQDMKESEQMLQSRDARITAEPLLSLMPEVFTIQQFKEERLRQGQCGEAKTLLSRYAKKGKVERVEKGVYRNLIKLKDKS